MDQPDDGSAETLEASPTATGEGGSGRPAAELHELRAGDAIGRYQIVGVLGAGGMGRVYRALDPDLNRELAIKVLRRAPGSGSGGLEHRLLREAQAMARLKHANLATVYDVGSVRGEVFIAFEFFDGQTLAAWMRAPGRTTAEKLRALVAAGRGLEAAHSAGVIHRDFKPENVLVATSGEVKVVDFGLARGVDAGADGAGDRRGAKHDALATDLTMTGSILGTPAYMAPEQHEGGAADARADQFGFAVSAWEALYGERPFKGKTLEALAAAILGGELQPPPATTDVPARVEQALRRALSVDPAARFATMGELLDALSPARADAEASDRVLRRPRRWRVAAAVAAALVGVGALVLAVGAGAGAGGGAGQRTAAAPDPKRAFYSTDSEAEQQRIVDTISRERPAWKACYASAMLADASIGAGTVAIEFEIGRDGRVVSTRIVADDFAGRGSVASCIGGASMAWQFPPRAGGDPVKVTFPFRFEPAGAGELDKERIRATIRDDIERVGSCYESALLADATIQDGTVEIDFEIGPDGRVVSTTIVADDFAGKGGIASCIGAKSMAWRFPPPSGGDAVHVSYPFSFRPTAVPAGAAGH